MVGPPLRDEAVPAFCNLLDSEICKVGRFDQRKLFGGYVQ